MTGQAAEQLPLYLMEVPPITINQPERKGIVGDVTLEALRRAGFAYQLVVVPSPRALAVVPELRDTLIIPLARLPEREANFTWIAEIVRVERAFYTRARRLGSFAEASGLRSIAVSRGSAGHSILLARGFAPAQIVEVNQGPSALHMVRAGRVDAWYNPVLEAELLQRQEGGLHLVQSELLGSTAQYLACSRRCDRRLVERLAAAVQSMREDGSLERIEAGYPRH
ncbi:MULTISPECIES: transporter substrate-binding domain-containing protein [unclassified Pseudomonas]|uniref:substrate-binding periplasmic protein n=1 Tax=unclassified Pseudomonas TaxID=196821 RepID=UPI002446F28C|nr:MULTISPECIES: transporter substrate-binding domain-containing protein [unclassified Pseudomonas]MDG9925200.1 transporter substrate-binding domain-containing protein [Pseudomonas sp. GD04045]MDH0035330.1 transporter substrate-binding domain-containing protein [Pseudomonas sp. GD04019]